MDHDMNPASGAPEQAHAHPNQFALLGQRR